MRHCKCIGFGYGIARFLPDKENDTKTMKEEQERGC